MRYLHHAAAQCALPPRDTTDEGIKMRFRIALGTVMVVALAAVAATGIASAAPGNNYACTGGNWTGDPATSTFTSIPSGNYASITVTGVCNIAPGAVINVTGNIHVAPGALLDAQSVTSTITVGHNVTAGPRSLLLMGCQPPTTIGTQAGVPCNDNPDGQTVITVNGNITAFDADTVILRKLKVNGNVSLFGGGGDIPWSIKGNTIGKNLTIIDVAADWLGVQFNTISGNAVLIKITSLDPGDPGRTVAVVENTVGNNLICFGLAPGVSPGFIPGETNHVGHHALGQCAAISTPL
jgi:hypothetical protein